MVQLFKEQSIVRKSFLATFLNIFFLISVVVVVPMLIYEGLATKALPFLSLLFPPMRGRNPSLAPAPGSKLP